MGLGSASTAVGFLNMYPLKHVSVKDSVVGEERIVQYLLAVLDTRGTPPHWKHLNNRRLDDTEYEVEASHEYRLKNLKPKKRNPSNRSNSVKFS
ncbi:hypothetical protein VIGAN_06084100 [Vigna angularis var. angularis]|uniref:Uncharacterized protein n=1 Tax=Vigna angularis var. angularis TaxID=157739 RepID=A0A0S3SA75_PHAAN|nr:hypothetical protein VIGAN_06084100 [Vigna angularis var. angularis]